MCVRGSCAVNRSLRRLTGKYHMLKSCGGPPTQSPKRRRGLTQSMGNMQRARGLMAPHLFPKGLRDLHLALSVGRRTNRPSSDLHASRIGLELSCGIRSGLKQLAFPRAPCQNQHFQCFRNLSVHPRGHCICHKGALPTHACAQSAPMGRGLE